MQKEDRRVEKTKTAIEDGLLSIMRKKDFAKITIQDIADTANINRGTVYFHYADKYDLVDKMIEKKLQDLKTVCAPISETATRQELTTYFTKVYGFFNDHYDFFSLMLKKDPANRFRELFQQFITDEMLKAPANSQVQFFNKEFALQFKISALVGLIEWWIQENDRLTVSDMAINTTEMFIRYQ